MADSSQHHISQHLRKAPKWDRLGLDARQFTDCVEMLFQFGFSHEDSTRNHAIVIPPG